MVWTLVERRGRMGYRSAMVEFGRVLSAHRDMKVIVVPVCGEKQKE